MHRGWVKLHRKTLDSELLTWGPNTLAMFVVLLLRANHRPSTFRGIPVGPGQVFCSIRELAKTLKMPYKRARIAFEHLQKCGTITAHGRAHVGTLVSLVNWETYNGGDEDEGARKGADKGARGAHEGRSLKNDKNVRPVENTTLSAAGMILSEYNETCGHVLPKAQRLTDGRRKAIKARLEEYGREALTRIFAKTKASAFLCGNNDRHWRADFDWLLKAENAVKVLEGKYDRAEARDGYSAVGRNPVVLDGPTREAMAAHLCPKCGGANPQGLSECQTCFEQAHPDADPAHVAEIFAPDQSGVPS